MASYQAMPHISVELKLCMCVLGVTVLKGQEEIEVHAPVVISNAGIFNTFQKFLPKHIQDKPGSTVDCSKST